MTRVFTPPQVALAAFVGTPVAGGILLAVNARRARRGWRALAWLVAGVAIEAAVIALAIALDGNALPAVALALPFRFEPLDFVMPLAGVVATGLVAHVQQRGLGASERASTLAAAGIGLVFLALAVLYFVLAAPVTEVRG